MTTRTRTPRWIGTAPGCSFRLERIRDSHLSLAIRTEAAETLSDLASR
jgi:hypothetical protein